MPLLELTEDVWVGSSQWKDEDMTVGPNGVINNLSTVYWSKALRYLPLKAHEPIDAYLNKLKLSTFRRLFRNAIEKDFAPLLSQVEFSDRPVQVEALDGDVDLKGNTYAEFIRRWVELYLRDGMAAVVVDYPGGTPPDNNAEFLQSGRRAFLQLYERKRIINWSAQERVGQPYLNWVVLLEYEQMQDGYATVTMPRYRHWYYVETDQGQRAAYSLYAVEQNDQGDWIQRTLDRQVTTRSEIPVVVLGKLESAHRGENMPLYELAELNLKLYRKEATYDAYAEICQSPTLIIQELSTVPSDVRQDYTVGIHSVLQNVEAKWLEVSGSSLQTAIADIERITRDIEKLTLSFFSGQSVEMTATQARLESVQAHATMEGYAIAIESAVKNVLDHIAAWETGDENASGGEVNVRQDLLANVTDGTIQDIFNAMLQGLISDELGYRLMQFRGFLPSDFDEEDLQRELQLRGLAIAQNFEDTAARAAQDTPLGL